MSVDRPAKRKTVSKRDSVSPKKPAKKKRPKSPTADNLEALLDLLDHEATPEAGLASDRKKRKSAAGRVSKPAREESESAGTASSFMQELARARADLHKERRARIALEEKADSLRSELTRLKANESAKVAELRRDSGGLQKQLAALEKQRRKLQDVRLDLESQLEAEQRQRELLIDQFDALNERLAAECSRREAIAADLEAAQRESERLKIEADAASSSWQAACDELRAEVALMTSRCEQIGQTRDAAQAAAAEQQSLVAALTERIADAETKLREQDELIRQTRTAADDSARSATEWEQRFQHEQATRVQIEQQLSEQVSEHDVAVAALESRIEEAQCEVAALREQLVSANSALEAAGSERTQLEQLVATSQREGHEAAAKSRANSEAAEKTRTELMGQLSALENQLADANQRHAASAAAEQQLRVELTDARQEKRKTGVAFDEATAANKSLAKRVSELEAKLAASNQQLARRQSDAKVVTERLQTDLAKAGKDLVESYEQLGAARIRLANTSRDRDHAQQQAAEAQRRANELSEEVTSLQAAVQREAASRRKAESVQKREAGDDMASALFEAEQRIERLSNELAASKGVEAAYQQKAARKVQQVKQELETLRQRLAEIEQRPQGG